MTTKKQPEDLKKNILGTIIVDKPEKEVIYLALNTLLILTGRVDRKELNKIRDLRDRFKKGE